MSIGWDKYNTKQLLDMYRELLAHFHNTLSQEDYVKLNDILNIEFELSTREDQ